MPSASIIAVFFCYTDVFIGDVPLFRGKSQYTRYTTRLENIVKQFDKKLKRLGFEAGYSGSHACRKGLATMVAAGFTVYPPIVALFICVRWILDGVKDKYLLREKAGDQYVKCCASCFDQPKKSFAVFPLYFDFIGLCENV